MAMLKIETIINLTTSEKNSEPKLVDKLMIGNEPSNDIWQYYMATQNVQDKNSHVVYSNYPELEWSPYGYNITSHKCRNFGMKTFPRYGAIGFYTPLVGNSKFLVPIHVEHSAKFPPPTLSMVDNGSTLTFTITPNEDMPYMCYRILLQNGYTTLEYVTYGLEITVDKPTEAGSYRCWCIGYVDEGVNISEDSNFIEFDVI